MNTLLADAVASGQDWISGQTLIAVISAIFGGGGIVYGGWKGRQAKEEAERRLVSGTVHAQIPQPLTQEQSANQASWKDNAHDHENLFNRMSKVEKDVARIEAKTDATFQFIQKQLDQLTNMTTQLFEKIIGKARK